MALQQLIVDKQLELSALCRQVWANKLYVFGSATRDDFKPESSDLDFIVDLTDNASTDYARRYFDLLKGLESLFKRPVDLLTDQSIKNPYLRARVDAERVLVHDT
jgi:predicted nucleotidyltransferase